MIKILFVIGQLGYGGAEHQLVYLARNLDREKYNVLVCSLSDNLPLKGKLDAESIETVVIPQVMKPDISRPIKLLKLVKSFQPDLIHSYLFVANTWARVVGATTKVPVVLTERSAKPRDKFSHSLINKALKPFGDIMIANSNAGAEGVIKNNLFNPDNIYVIQNGLPFERFSRAPNSAKREILQSQLGINNEDKVIGIIASFEPEKNHEYLFESYKLIKKDLPKTKILCIGDGSRRDFLFGHTKQLGISDAVIFAGRRDDIPDCLSLMDVLVLPSKWEGCPNVILEAMAAKVPVVATDVGGVSEVLLDGVTGLLVPLDNPQILAQKIISILTDPDKAAQFGREGRKRVGEHFSIEMMISKTEEIYTKILLNE
jgi:glycosyltransferase involved in cell wall biosynthesis